MAILKRMSFVPDKVNRYEIGRLIYDGAVVRVTNAKDIGSLCNAADKGAVIPYSGDNEVWFRIDETVATWMRTKARNNIILR